MSTGPQQKLERAIQLHQAGKLKEAERLYADILALEPRNFTASHFLGVIRYQQGRTEEAIMLIRAALGINPASPAAQSNLGLALQVRGELEAALAAFDKAIALKPGDADSHNNRGNMLAQMNRFEEALAAFNAALALKPQFADALNNRGNVLLALGRGEEALVSYNQAIAARPDFADAFYNRGQPLLDAMRLEEALASYDRAIALKPGFANALSGRAMALQRLGRLPDALAGYDAALKIAPDLSVANNRASLLLLAKRFEEARAAFRGILESVPQNDQAFAGLAAAALYLCDWPLVAELAPEVKRRVEQGRAAIDPLILTGYFDDPVLQIRAAGNYQRDRVPPAPPVTAGAPMAGRRIKIAYLSGDFHTHATASLVAGLFESHDRSRFEVHAVSYGPDDGSAMRARLKNAVEHFHDVRGMSDRDVAKLLADNQTGIAVDLKGHTQGARPAILSFRPAPVQVTYLGFPGSTAADYMDYLIADPIVLPRDQISLFREKIVHLPYCYQTNDSKRPVAPTSGRAAAGLPEKAFVFCCFNNNWKITQTMFEIWMRLLNAVPGSVLWLFRDNERASGNLRREAAARDIDPARLVFATYQPEAEHLGRQQLADLFLDTLPYNAHTTGSDALWGGLPVLTCHGASFPGRVGASLLHAAGLPELVTPSLAEYEATALRLAKNPAELGALKEKLARTRLASPLFDTNRFRRDIESAYAQMWQRALRGEPPASFAIQPD